MDVLRNQLNQLAETNNLPFDEEHTNVATSSWKPSVDIKEEEDRYVFLADIPGVDPKDIEVTAENGILTIKGERKSETKEDREGYKRIERSSGSFYRRFSLPDTGDIENIKAESKNGVLELTVPKTPNIQARKIDIKS
ncbi:MAG: HSP20 family protein [Planctomycetota bacterium]